jgi:hypothetical protein
MEKHNKGQEKKNLNHSVTALLKGRRGIKKEAENQKEKRQSKC